MTKTTDTAVAAAVEVIAKIDNVRIGYEDHGIFTVSVGLDYGGTHQGAGGYCLDEPANGSEWRRGTAFGLDWIIRLMAACGVDDVSKIKGRTVLAIKDSDAWGAKVIGLKPLPTEKGKTFMFDELRDEHFAATAKETPHQ